ncbi:DegT/DnrJ/EryC1/StrS family aminotransferase [Candidatus Latescibacterota bacterium]
MTTIPITKPWFDESEEQLVLEVLRSGWVVQGPQVAEFERLVAEYTGARHAIATTSCTTALHLALVAAGVGAGDEVIVPAFTWVATANVVEHTGATPVFCDIDLATYNLDPGSLAQKVTARTKALIPVHLFGLCAQMDPIVQIAEERGVHVIEDAACALGSWYGGRHAGTFGLAGCFSFHPRKPITTGEGGMLITNDDHVATVCRALRDHGAEKSDRARHDEKRAFLLTEYRTCGYNYRMTDLQAALGVAQMGKLRRILDGRMSGAHRYDELLADCMHLRTPDVPAGSVHSYQSYVCLYAPEAPSIARVSQLHEERNEIMVALEDQGISTRQGTHAVHMLDYYRGKYGLTEAECPNAWIADRLSLSLPLYVQLGEREQERVVEQLRAAVS